jgi:DNA helicase-2/ATP-dependent DNA helicase PcrA
MIENVQLRPAQAEILQYNEGPLAISAVPGSGKTYTLSLLAAKLIAEERIQPMSDQQVLVVTYLNASVDTFRARIRKQLLAQDLPDKGYDVRTLHSLALEIVRQAHGGLGAAEAIVLDETQTTHFLATAVDQWIAIYPHLWQAFLNEENPQTRARWRATTERTARAFIRTAKNERYTSAQIAARLEELAASSDSSEQQIDPQLPLVRMLNGVYGRYQTILDRQGALDFDDLIWGAADLLEQREGFAARLRQRWPFVLEDEAQDSVPLQEQLISKLVGSQSNWVRVGDPNQAITSTFTAAHPRFFNAFADREEVRSLPLPNSGRSAPLIFRAANRLLDWVMNAHSVSEVRRQTFRRQYIQPTPPGDSQPNPPDSEAEILIKVYRHREDEELPKVTQMAIRYALDQPQHTLAILVPTNLIGMEVANHLDEAGAHYDNLLRGGTREREIAAAMHAILAVLADPQSTKAMVAAHSSLHALDHPAALLPEEQLQKFHTLLKSVHLPESLLYPLAPGDVAAALPTGVASEEDLRAVERFSAFLQQMFTLRPLPIDDLALALGDELFAWGEVHEGDIAIAYQIATLLRRWRDAQPEWRLPDLVAELEGIVAGRRSLPLQNPTNYGFEPEAGRITLSTQHSAKGLEWDAVFIVGVDGVWIPNNLEAYFQGVSPLLGGDPTAEALAQLRFLMQGDAGIYPGRTATESAHIDIICERLRLLYVGITRAQRRLHISRSRASRHYNKERDSEPATVMGVLYQYLQNSG